MPERCKDCYPDRAVDEKPLIETDPTSTVPTQQIVLSFHDRSDSADQKCFCVDTENLKRLSKIKGSVYYGHYKRGKNHFQFYIDTNKYFSKVENDVREWLENYLDKHKATPHNPITEAAYNQTNNNILESLFAANTNQTASDFTKSLSAR